MFFLGAPPEFPLQDQDPEDHIKSKEGCEAHIPCHHWVGFRHHWGGEHFGKERKIGVKFAKGVF